MPTESSTQHIVRCTVVAADKVVAGASNGGDGGCSTGSTPTTIQNQLLKPKYQNLTKISLGEDTYTIVGVPGTDLTDSNGISLSEESKVGSFRVIRRSGRWKRGSTSPNTTQQQSNNSTINIGVNMGEEFVAGYPNPESAAGCREAQNRLKAVLEEIGTGTGTGSSTGSTTDTTSLITQLQYIQDVLNHLSTKVEHDVEDDLSELKSEAVPDEVRKWLASTFAKQEQVVKKSEERPSFKSVANAIRTGIFIERIYRRMSTSQLMFIPPDVDKYLKHVDDWNFDIFSFAKAAKGSPLIYLGYHLLQIHGCLHKYKIPPSTLETLLSHLESGYARNQNPYHNNLHASDVLQTTHWFISQTGLKDCLSDLEVFALLFSAIIHDYDHSGTTNNFHIQSGSGLAMLYNDRAVLENHHVAEFFKTMTENECNILNNMNKIEFREFRSLMIEMVLHTDMSMHFSQLKSMKTLIQSSTDGASLDKTKVLSLLLHSCDVSHPSKRWDLHHQWTARCMQEFFRQGDMERDMGLEFSPLCDRQNTMVPQSQIGFIDYIVTPTLGVAGDAVNLILSHRNKEIEKPWNHILPVNKSKWQEKAEKGETGIEISEDMIKDIPQPFSIRQGSARFRENGIREEKEPVTSSNQSMEEKEEVITLEEEDENEVETTLSQNTTTITFQSKAPEKPITTKEVLSDLPGSVISKPGSPTSWSFDVKDSLSTLPPSRPNTASIIHEQDVRRAPVSVDHKLRKNPLHF